MCVDEEKMITVLVLLIMSQEGAGSSGGSVTFENPDPCALKGLSVVFRCSYNYTAGQTVTKAAWYKGFLKNHTWTRVKLSDAPSYENRTEYLGDMQHNCNLAIHDLQDSDAGYYYFRFDTDRYGRHRKESVHLSLTEMSARVRPQSVRAGNKVTLECATPCQPPGVVWLRDGQPVAEPEFLAQAGDSGNYSCAIDGQVSDPVALQVWYPPFNVSIELSHPGHLAEGSSVNLTCSSVANPAADSYTWYKAAGSNSSSVHWVGSGPVLSLHSVNATHTGLYSCQARNSIGENSSAQVLLTVSQKDARNVILLVGIGVKIVILLILSVVIIWAWRTKCNSAVEKEQNHDYENVILNR